MKVPRCDVATIAEESSLSHYYCRFSEVEMGPKSPIAHSIESDKRLSEGLKNGPKVTTWSIARRACG